MREGLGHGCGFGSWLELENMEIKNIYRKERSYARRKNNYFSDGGEAAILSP